MYAADPLISIIIPVLHEATAINPLIKHLRDLPSSRPPEIIVVDGSERGDTLSAIRPGDVVKVATGRGRARQMNAGAERAHGDVLLFLHADTELPAGAFSAIRRCFEDYLIVAGAFDLGIRSRRGIFRITELYVALRTRLTRVPFGDQAIFIRKDYFQRLKGFRDIPIMEDVELMGRIRKRGDRIRIIPRKVITSSRRWDHEGVIYATLRNWTLQLFYAFGVSPERLAGLYGSHKRPGVGALSQGKDVTES